MRNKWFKILAVLLISGIASAGAILDFFTVQTDGEYVKIEWKTGEENNIDHFSIQRKTPQTDYIEIVQIKPRGSYSFYSYIDQSIYKSENTVFSYQLVIINNDQTRTKSREISASPNISGVKRTWGSIKAMFR